MLLTMPRTISRHILGQISPQLAWVLLCCHETERIWERRRDSCPKYSVSLCDDFCLSLFWGYHLHPVIRRAYRCRQPSKNIFTTAIYGLWTSYMRQVNTVYFFLNLVEQDSNSCTDTFCPYNHGQATNAICTSIFSSIKWVMVILIGLLWGIK